MKTAIYIEDGIVQLVFTPEGKFEKNALDTIYAKPLEAKIFSGSFYDCRGGWVRQKHYYPQSDTNDNSLILRINEAPQPAEGEE